MLRAEKSETLSDELVIVDQRVAAMVKGLEHTKKKLIESLRSFKSTSSSSSTKEDGNVEKRRKALEEYKLAQAIMSDARTFDGSLLSDVMTISGEALNEIVEEIVQHEAQVEQHVLEKLTKFHEDLKNINNQKEKLKKLVLDMDSAKSRLATNQAKGERVNEIQDELDNAQMKVDSCKDTLACDLYTLASKEVDMAVIFKVLLQLQIDYHRTALKHLEAAEPLLVEKIDTFSHRPVYGCPLEDHLRYSGREIALVLEVCCSALSMLGLKDEGLFRISGNAIKVRKLKAAFDAGTIDLGEFDRDPHSIAGALKSYLRELPDSLMTNNLYRDWMSAVGNSNPESRLVAIKDVISKLPKPNYANLRYLIKFLSKLVENQQYTKMSSSNLAIVMAPNMLWNTIEGEGFGVNNAHGNLVEILISNANFFFPGDVKFNSPLVAAIIDKTGGFLENGAISNMIGLSVNVAKAYTMDDGQQQQQQSIDGQLSPARPFGIGHAGGGGSTRRPKQPAPLPPPGGPMARGGLDRGADRALPEEPCSSSNDEDDQRRGAAADDDVDDFDDDFGFSPTVETPPEQPRLGLVSISNRPTLPPRPPPAAGFVIPTTQSIVDQSVGGHANPAFNIGHAGVPPPPGSGHKKTKSLDRPLRPPPRLNPSTTNVAVNSESLMNRSMDRSTNRGAPAEDDLEAILLAGFGDLGGGGHGTPAGRPPVQQQPQRPPLPTKLTTTNPNRSSKKKVGQRGIAISESSEESSADDEPVVTSMETDNIYYDVPSTGGGIKNQLFSMASNMFNSKESSSSMMMANNQDAYPAVSLVSIKRQDQSSMNPNRIDQSSNPGPVRRQSPPESSTNGSVVAQKRESLMKLFAGDQQQQSSSNIPAIAVRPPKPPIPSKPRSAEFNEKDITRF